MYKRILAVLLAMTISTPAFAAYEEIDCSSDSVFSEYSCTQCFDGGKKGEDTYIGLLSDEWKNTGDNNRIIFKEQQNFPEMINLNTSKVEWTQTPSSNDFWEYTPEFENLYSESDAGHILAAGESVTWIKSKLSYAYKLEKNEVESNGNIGLLIYPILSHVILPSGEITMDNETHNECVLYKSGEPAKQNNLEPKRLPETGPAEFLLLLVLAMILGFGILKLRTN